MGSVKARVEDEMETPKVGLHSHSWVGGPFPGKKPRPTGVVSPPAKLQQKSGHVIEDLLACMHGISRGLLPQPPPPHACLSPKPCRHPSSLTSAGRWIPPRVQPRLCWESVPRSPRWCRWGLDQAADRKGTRVGGWVSGCGPRGDLGPSGPGLGQ